MPVFGSLAPSDDDISPYYDPGTGLPVGGTDKYVPPSTKPKRSYFDYSGVGAAMPEASVQPGQMPPDLMLNVAKKSLYDVPKGLIDTARAMPPPGLRREDYTDIPGSAQPYDPIIRQTTNLASGMVGGPAIGPAEEGVALGAGAIRQKAMQKALDKTFSSGPQPTAEEVPPRPPDITTQPMSAPRTAAAGFGSIAPAMRDEDELLASQPKTQVPADVDWSKMNQPFGEVSDPGGKVVIATKDPRFNITQRDLDKATDVALSFSGGGLATKEASIAAKAARAEKAAAAQAKADALAQAQTRASQIADKYGPVGSHPDEEALTVNDILHPDTPAQPPRSKTVEQIAAQLQSRGQAALRNLGVESGQITEPHPVHDEHVARAMASEVQQAMARGEAGGKSAADWYTGSIDEAMKHAEDIWPELKNDPHQKMGLTAALAVTSQGENVANNVRLAEQAYDHFRTTGRFPTNIESQNKEMMNGNFQKLNDLIDELGPEGARDFLHRDFTVKELNQMGHDIGGENKGTTVKGSAILGPKIGGGFYQNLNGNYDPVTMDMWFMRAMGRLQGTLVGRPIEKPQMRFENAMRDAGMRVPNDPDNLQDLAKQIMSTHERDFRNNRAMYDSGEKTKSELTLSADRYLANLKGINETPTSGGHREWLRGIVNRARNILADQGTNLTNADLQAIWWYPEKELYSKLGGVDSEALNTDYATTFKDLKARRAAAAAGAQPQPQELGAVEH